MIANRVSPYLSAQSLVIQKLRHLHRFGWDDLLRRSVGSVEYRGARKLYKSPTNTEVLRFGARRAAVTLRRRLPRALGGTRAPRTDWAVAVRTRRESLPWRGDWNDWHWIAAPKGHYYADPMLCNHDGKTYILVEDFDVAIGRASIAAAELRDDIGSLEFRTVLSTPYHLSFPYTFARGSEMFMVPETKSAGRIELYRALEFPFKWQRERPLLEYPGVDTIFHVLPDGRELMLTAIADVAGAQAAMHLFVADNIAGKWQLHPRSPIHCDVRFSRNAGPLLDLPDVGLVRVSQDGSKFYGRQMHFHRIAEISADNYVEETIAVRSPSDLPRKAQGAHSYSATERWEAIDALVS
jgi:hypothetical protein